MRSPALTCLLILIATVLALPAAAVDLFVFPDGSGLYPTIQEALDEASDGDTIYLMPGTFTGPGNRDLNVATTVTVRSNDIWNPSVIDCQGSAAEPHRGFSLQAGIPTLEYLIVRNGYADVGGAVVGDGGDEIYLNYCQFENNTATQYGGALHTASGEVVTANHCIFSGNLAGIEGGAVYADATEIKLYNCTLFRNEAPAGSGVFLFRNAVCRLNSTIIAYGLGGAACSDNYGGGYIIGCTDIYANQGGDWVGNLAGDLALNNNVSVDPMFCDPMDSPANFKLMASSPVGPAHPCGVLGAKLTDPAWVAPVYGVMADGKGMFSTIQAAVDAVPAAAIISLAPGTFSGLGNRDIELRGKDLVITGRYTRPDSVIIDVGGSLGDPHRGFYVHEGEPQSTALKYLTIRNGFAKVDPFSAVYTGGAILLANQSSLTILTCVFDDNIAYELSGLSSYNGKGAAIHVKYAPLGETQPHGLLSITGSLFNNNLGAQAVLVESGAVDLINCSFRGNLAGVELTTRDWECYVSGCNFNDYTRFAVSATGLPRHLDVRWCNFYPVTGASVAVSTSSCNSVLFEQCLFDGLVTASSWGAVAAPVFLLDSNVEFRGSTFSRCFSPEKGAIFGINTYGLIQDCVFTGNSSGGAGSAVYLEGGSGELRVSTFTNNTSDHGGAVYMSGVNASLFDCSFADNSSVLDGGAVSLVAGTSTFDNCDFDRNLAGRNGGALVSDGATAVLDNCRFSENAADTTGGAIYTLAAQTTVNSCEITGSSAVFIGGGAYHREGMTWYDGGRVAGNDAHQGGGIASSNGTIELNNLQVIGNTANGAGGVSGSASNLTFNNCEVVANEADTHGGLYFYQGSTAVLSHTLIAKNTAILGDASGVMVLGNSDVTFLQSTISGNGGANSQAQIYGNDSASVSFSSSVISFSTNGPALEFLDAGSTVQIESSNVFGNSGGDWAGPLAGLAGGAFNFSLDPQFCDTGLRNYHLADTSPCVGLNNPSGLDIGAYGTGCSGVSGVEDDESELPRSFALLGNSPNPFNPRTNISFDLPGVSAVTLQIFDLSGRLVRTLVSGLEYPAGRHSVMWDGADDGGQAQSSGVYLYQLAASGKSVGGKMALLR